MILQVILGKLSLKPGKRSPCSLVIFFFHLFHFILQRKNQLLGKLEKLKTVHKIHRIWRSWKNINFQFGE